MSDWDDIPTADEWNGIPLVNQRTVAGVLDTENAANVARARKVGIPDKDIPAFFNPPNAVKGDSWLPDWYERYQAGVGQLITNTARGLVQTKQHLTPGQDTTDIDAQVAEHKALQERGGLNADTAARTGRLAGGAAVLSAAPILAPETMAAAPFISGALEGGAITAAEGETDPDYWTGKGKSAAINVGLGGGTAKAADLGIKALTATRNMPNAVNDYMMSPASGRPMIRASAADIAEGNRLATSTGIDTTAGQRGQSGALLQAEQYARESILSRDVVREADAIRAKQLEEGLELYANSLGPRVPKEVAATKLQSWVEDHATDMYDARQAQADRDYAPIQQWDQGNPSIPATNYRNTLLRIINEGKGTGAGQDAVVAASEAMRRLAALKAQGYRLTGMDVDRITRAADGNYGGTVFDVNSRSFGTELTNSLNKAVREDVRGIKPLDKLLFTAKKNYAQASDSIEALESSGLGKVVGEQMAGDLVGLRYNKVAPGQVFDRLWRADPIDLKISMQYLDKNAPEIANQMRQAVIREGMEAAKLRPAAGGIQGEMDPGRVLRFLGVSGNEETMLANQQRLKAWFAGTDEEPLFNDLLEQARRMADRTKANTSGTDIRAEARGFMQSLQTLFQGVMTGLSKLGGLATTQVAMRGIANRMNPADPAFLTGGARYQMTPKNAQRITTLPPIPAMVASQELREY